MGKACAIRYIRYILRVRSSVKCLLYCNIHTCSNRRPAILLTHKVRSACSVELQSLPSPPSPLSPSLVSLAL
jgi:hypothetical protein